jgi:hypothetical protein
MVIGEEPARVKGLRTPIEQHKMVNCCAYRQCIAAGHSMQTPPQSWYTTTMSTPVYCEECGEPIYEDASPDVWLHDEERLGSIAYDLNEDHAARPPSVEE